MSTSNIDLRALKELAICDNSSVLSDHPADMSIVCRSDSLYLSGDISRCPGSTTACANAPESHGILSRALEKKATIYSQILDAISYHKVPLTILLSFLFLPRLMILWVYFVLFWTLCELIWTKLPDAARKKAHSCLPPCILENSWLKEIRSGIAQVRPFLLLAVYFCCAPISLVWMFWHWLTRGVFRLPDKTLPRGINRQDECVVFVQGKEVSRKDEEANFFHSPAFTLTAISIFACGLPAALTYSLYRWWGIDAFLGHPSSDPQFFLIIVVIGFYLASLSWSLMILFFRAWFTFPLNFTGNEEEIHLTSRGLERKSPNWFTRVLTCNCAVQTPDSLAWSDITSLTYQSTARLYPLPDKLIEADSLLHKIMNRLAAFYDSIIDCLGRVERITFKTGSLGAFVSNQISLNLSELTGEERARLFYAVKKWAAHVVIDDKTREKLLGSAVLQEPQYTQVWFDLLTSKQERQRQRALQAGDILGDRYVIIERIASGGQANAYLATQIHESPGNASAENYVLKEFILSTSDAVGALLESAREFESEASLLSRLEHEHIVREKDFFAEDRRAYLVLEHIEGKSLRQLVQANGPLAQEQVIELAGQMCEVLHYLHSQAPAVVHRDFSPDNLILHETRGLVLIDFSLSGSENAQRKRTVIGKHSYTPPEQFRQQAGPQSDIYALGATLHFLLTGKDPKPISSSSPRLVNGSVLPALNEIVEKATCIDLDKRYAEISWLQLDLQNLRAVREKQQTC